MEPQDRERLVRVEEGVKEMRADLKQLTGSFRDHSNLMTEDRIKNAKSITALNVKAGIWGLLGAALIGMFEKFSK